jgi:hypothetical protein
MGAHFAITRTLGQISNALYEVRNISWLRSPLHHCQHAWVLSDGVTFRAEAS